jgi:hypothetical protein
MSLSGVEKDIETETEQVSSPIDFEVNPSTSIQAPKLSFKDLQKQRQQIIGGSSKYESTYVPSPSSTFNTGKSVDLRLIILTLSRKIRDLEKRKSQIEADIEDCENDIEITQEQIINQQVKILLEHNGISQELMDEYEKFRAIIEPTSGQRSGCSITCFGDHRGSYIKYDPSLDLFKENVEDDWEGCHYRCEASKVDGPWKTGESGEEREKECIVEFWPVPAPVLKTNGVTTWGDLFVCRHQLLLLQQS